MKLGPEAGKRRVFRARSAGLPGGVAHAGGMHREVRQGEQYFVLDDRRQSSPSAALERFVAGRELRPSCRFAAVRERDPELGSQLEGPAGRGSAGRSGAPSNGCVPPPAAPRTRTSGSAARPPPRRNRLARGSRSSTFRLRESRRSFGPAGGRAGAGPRTRAAGQAWRADSILGPGPCQRPARPVPDRPARRPRKAGPDWSGPAQPAAMRRTGRVRRRRPESGAPPPCGGTPVGRKIAGAEERPRSAENTKESPDAMAKRRKGPGSNGADDHPDARTCHWPGCERQIPPHYWACAEHWAALPKRLRDSRGARLSSGTGDRQAALAGVHPDRAGGASLDGRARHSLTAGPRHGASLPLLPKARARYPERMGPGSPCRRALPRRLGLPFESIAPGGKEGTDPHSRPAPARTRRTAVAGAGGHAPPDAGQNRARASSGIPSRTAGATRPASSSARAITPGSPGPAMRMLAACRNNLLRPDPLSRRLSSRFAVLPVTRDRMAERRAVDADLVGAARVRKDLRERHAGTHRNPREVGHRFAARLGDPHHPFALRPDGGAPEADPPSGGRLLSTFLQAAPHSACRGLAGATLRGGRGARSGAWRRRGIRRCPGRAGARARDTGHPAGRPVAARSPRTRPRSRRGPRDRPACSERAADRPRTRSCRQSAGRRRAVDGRAISAPETMRPAGS